MAFDIKTAREIKEPIGFDISTAREVVDSPEEQQSYGQKMASIAAQKLGRIPMSMLAFAQKVEQPAANVKQAALGSIDNMAREYGGNPELKAAMLTPAKMLTEFLPFTPSEFAIAGAGEVGPLATNAGKLSAPIANRFVNAPKAIAEKRLERGLPPLGEELLSREKYLGDIFSSKSPKEIYNRVTFGIKKLGNEIKNEISSFGKGNVVDLNSIGNRNAFNNVVDSMLSKRTQFALNDSEVSVLNKVRNSDTLDLETADKFRKIIGGDVGRKFNRVFDELPELTQAQDIIYGKLRDAMGAASGKLDNLLKEQHTLLDIKHSLSPTSAKGYNQIPGSEISFLSNALGAKSMRLAQLLKQAAGTRFGGIALETAEKSAFPDIRK